MNFLLQSTLIILATVGVMDASRMTMLMNFPTGISCARAVETRYELLQSNGTFQCVIRRGAEVRFNKTILWKNSTKEGLFFDATADWDNVTVTVSAVWESGNNSMGFQVFVQERVEANCSHDSVGNRLGITVKMDTAVACDVPFQLRMGMSKQQFKTIDTTWYKECELIERNDSRYEYMPAEYGRMFQGLKIKSATFEETPGTYYCILQYKGKEMKARTINFCVQGERDDNLPMIIRTHSKYTVQPGQDLTVSCHGLGGDSYGTRVRWKKEGRDETLCLTSYFSKRRQCSFSLHRLRFCEAATKDEIKTSIAQRPGSFVANFTLKNLSHNDSGTYSCILNSISGSWSDQFTITVRDENPIKTTMPLIIAGSLALLAMSVILIILILLYAPALLAIIVFAISFHLIKRRTQKSQINYSNTLSEEMYRDKLTSSSSDGTKSDNDWNVKKS